MNSLPLSLKALEAAWAANYPERAQGGKRAISGFRYQFQVYLLRLVEHWIEIPINDRCNIDQFYFAAEAVSDILHLEKTGLVVATQIKLTLRSGALSDTLKEFLTIYTTTSEHCPELLSLLRFRLLCNKSEVLNIKNVITVWKEKHRAESGLDVDLMAEVIEVVSEIHPENKLLTLLANSFNYIDPLNKIREWLGLLIETESIESVYKVIWNDLHKLWRGKLTESANLYLWHEDDLPPAEVETGKVLTGQRASVRHLREGYFAQRPQIYKTLENSLLDWSEKTINETDKIPLFWIAGRSGTGKSVALLHMLARLHEKGYAPIIWLGNNISLLGSAIRFTIDNEMYNTESIIGIDDPYVASAQEGATRYWNDVLASLHSIRQKEGTRRLPRIVVCGPTEQAELFRSDYCDDLDVHISELPHETSDELATLREWYYLRTGTESPAAGDVNVLMVQLFFQWEKHESIMEFAQRLYKRLIASDTNHNIVAIISRILALNRLYVGYPSAAIRLRLTSSQQDILDHLENELHIGEREDKGLQSYWLLHAHLANAIYLNWYVNKPSSFKGHLKEGILESLKFFEQARDRVAPLWAISRIFDATSGDLSKRLNRSIAVDLLGDIYKELSEEHGLRFPQFLIPVWVQIDTSLPELDLRPSPIEIAIESIKPENINEKGLRLTCHKLLQHYNHLGESYKKAAINVILNLLANTPEWHDWMPIAQNTLLVCKDKRIIPIIINYLKSNVQDDRIAKLVYEALQAWPDNVDLVSQALVVLRNAPSSFDWGDLAQFFITRSEVKIPDEVLHWLQIHRESQFICFALGKALKKQYANVEPIALEWARLWHFSTSANFVLEPILQIRQKEPEVISWACEWLITGDGDKSFVLESLLRANPNNTQINLLALAWLQDTDMNKPSWKYVFQALLKYKANIFALRELMLKWLQSGNSDDTSSILIWRSLFEHDNDDKVLYNTCIEWLQRVDPNILSWFFVWKTLYKQYTSNNKLTEIALQWLQKVDKGHASWHNVWKLIYKQDPFNMKLYDITLQWLEYGNLEHKYWFKIWRILFTHNLSSMMLYNIALMWLQKVDANQSTWFNTWKLLFLQDQENKTLIDISEECLKKIDINGFSWQYVWIRLYDKAPTNGWLQDVGIKWLKEVDPTHISWTFVWKRLYDQNPVNVVLRDIALNWLQVVGASSASVQHVWEPLFKENYVKTELLSIADKWLHEIDPKDDIRLQLLNNLKHL